MKTFVGAVLTLGSYQIVTIDEETIGKYDFAFEVNWQETGVRTTSAGANKYQYPQGGFDMKLFRKGVSGDFEINGWKFPGFLNGTYEDRGEPVLKIFLKLSVLDPEGNTDTVELGYYKGDGPKSIYTLMAFNYLEKIFEYCIYKNINEHNLATRPQSRYLLQNSIYSPKELLEQVSTLQIIAESIRNLDNCEDIPEHIKEASRQKYHSLLTQIKNSKEFEKVFEKLLGFDFIMK